MKPRAFVLIELLIVLVVIAILAGGYFAHPGTGSKASPSMYQTSMNKSGNAACTANRAALRTMIEMFRVNHPGEAVTTENLRKAGSNPPSCPQGGVYGFKKDGTIICSKHPD